MQIWTGKFCLLLAFVLTGANLISACSSKENAPATKDEIPAEVSLKDDNKAIEALRKDVPEDKKEINDRLAEMLNRWKADKMDPERLREHFEDEIRKLRATKEHDWTRRRQDFQRQLDDQRRDFLAKQKSDRDDYFSKKRTSEERSDFSSRQSSDRERFFDDQHDARSEFEGKIKDERKDFEDFVADRWSEFRGEYPEYVRIYNEMKKAEEKKLEKERENPKPYSGWPYKMPGDNGAPGAGDDMPANAKSAAPGAQKPAAGNPNDDVNKGGNGWPSTDPSEFNQMNGH